MVVKVLKSLETLGLLEVDDEAILDEDRDKRRVAESREASAGVSPESENVRVLRQKATCVTQLRVSKHLQQHYLHIPIAMRLVVRQRVENVMRVLEPLNAYDFVHLVVNIRRRFDLYTIRILNQYTLSRPLNVVEYAHSCA